MSVTFMHSVEKCGSLQNAHVIGHGFVVLLGFTAWVRKAWVVAGELYSMCESLVNKSTSPPSMASISVLIQHRKSVSVHSLFPWSLAMSSQMFPSSFSCIMGMIGEVSIGILLLS